MNFAYSKVYIRASHKCAKGGPLLCGARCNPLKFIHDIHSVIPKQKRFCHMADGYVTNNESLISLKSFVKLSPPSPQPGSGCVNCLYRHHILYLWDIQLRLTDKVFVVSEGHHQNGKVARIPKKSKL